MLVLGEQGVVLDGVAEAADLFSEVIGALVHESVRVSDFAVFTLVVSVLDGAGVLEGVILSPSSVEGLQLLEGLALEVDTFGSDNEVGLFVSALRVGGEEGHDGNTTNSPGVSRASHSADGGGEAGKTVLDQNTSGETVSGTELGVEVRGMSGTSLVTEEVSHGAEDALVGASLLSSVKLFSDEVGEEFLGLNLGELNFSTDFSLEEKCLLEEIGKGGVQRVGPGSEQSLDGNIVGKLLLESVLLLLFFNVFEKLVELAEKLMEGRDVGEETFGDDNATVVLVLVGSGGDDISNVVDDVLEGLETVGALLGDDHDVRLGLEGTLEGQVGRLLAHKSDKVPVLDGGGRVGEHVSDQLGVHLGGSVETNRGLNVLVVNVSVNGGGNDDDSGLDLVLDEVLRQGNTVGHGVGGTDEHETSEAELLGDLSSGSSLLLGSEGVLASADVIVSTKVVVVLEGFSGKLDSVGDQKSLNTTHETNDGYVLSLGLESQKTVNDVVTSRGLSAHEDNTNFLGRLLVDVEEVSVDLGKSLVGLSETHVSEELILDLDEVAGRGLFAERAVLFLHLLVNELGDGEELLGASDVVGVSLEHLGDLSLLLNSSSGQLAKKGSVSEKSVLFGNRELDLFLSLGFSNEHLNIGRGNHKVELIKSGSGELDGSGGDVAVEVGPEISHGFVGLEHATVELDEGLGNDGLVFSSSALNSHHGGERSTGGGPVGRVLVSDVLDAGHISGESLADEHGGVETERVAVLGVEVTGKGTTTLISEEVRLGLEVTIVFLVFASDLKFILEEKDKEFLSVDLGHLHVAMRISVEQELVGDGVGQEVEEGLGSEAQVLGDVLSEVAGNVGLGNKFVNFLNKISHLGNELNEALGHQNNTVVLSKFSAFNDDVSNLGSDLGEGHVLLSDFLANQHAVDLSSEGAFEGNVGSGATHKPDEMVVLFGGNDI